MYFYAANASEFPLNPWN